MVIGGNKLSAIARYKILLWNHEQFKEYLSKPETRLIVIGYSFRDEYINEVIGEVADRGTLRLFIIDPDGVDVLDKDRHKLAWKPQTAEEWYETRSKLLARMERSLIGASRRTLGKIFGGDTVEHGKVMRFFVST